MSYEICGKIDPANFVVELTQKAAENFFDGKENFYSTYTDLSDFSKRFLVIFCIVFRRFSKDFYFLLLFVPISCSILLFSVIQKIFCIRKGLKKRFFKAEKSVFIKMCKICTEFFCWGERTYFCCLYWLYFCFNIISSENVLDS